MRKVFLILTLLWSTYSGTISVNQSFEVSNPGINRTQSNMVNLPNSRNIIYIDYLEGRNETIALYAVNFPLDPDQNETAKNSSIIAVLPIGNASKCGDSITTNLVMYDYQYVAFIHTPKIINSTTSQCMDYLSIYRFDDTNKFTFLIRVPTNLNTISNCSNYRIDSMKIMEGSPRYFVVLIKWYFKLFI